jgi:type IV secretory pathway VirB10-like protein
VPEAVPAPPDVELPAERSVEAREQVAASEREVLEATQRELDRRQRELERRERALKAAERREAAERPAPQSAPAETEDVAPSPAPEPEPERAEPAPEPQPEEPRPEPATVETGTVFGVEFLETLSSATSRPGEIFRARVTSDLRQDGRVVIPAGSEVVGEVTEAVPLRKVGGRAKLAVRFTDLVLPAGNSVPIEASFVGQGKSETGRDAATIGGAAAGGAILGRVLNKGDRSKGAVIGAILGAVIGTAVASRTPGEEVTINEGSVVDLKLDAPVEIRPRR